MPCLTYRPWFVAVGLVVLTTFPAAISARATTPTRHHRHPLHRGDTPLASRGRYDRAIATALPRLQPQTITGRIAVVSSDQAVLRREYTESSRVLSKVPQGTNLALVYEAGTYYGVLMADNSVGWVAKSSVRMIDYQVEVTPPPGSQLAATAAAVAAGVPPPDSDGSTPTGGGTSSGSRDLSMTAQAAAGAIPGNAGPRAYALLQEAFTYLGVPYVWAGTTRAGLDCSAFVQNVFSTQGVTLPRVAADQSKVGALVDWADLQPGDRLYFDMGNRGRVSHTGIYIGNGYFIHASTNHGHVDVDPLMKPNYYKALVCARRSL